MELPDTSQSGPVPSARERIIGAAYELFTHRGVRAVSMDEVIEGAGVAKATLYRHFRTKNDLVLEVLARREQLWTYELVEAGSRRRGDTPEEQLLAIFDVLNDWYHERDDHDGCSFIRVLLEMGPAHPAGAASIKHHANFRAIVRRRAEAAGLLDVDNFARCFSILGMGAMIAATEGDVEAAHRAQEMARLLIEQHRPAAPSGI
jgi:AcrR family transcriptional regulator